MEDDRRFKRFIFGTSLGFCHANRYQGEACHVYHHHALGNPDMYLDYCPCDTGLVCKGTTVDGNIHHNPVCVPGSDSTTKGQTVSSTSP